MAKNSTKIKTLLESMLKRIKMGQLTANKHVEAQLAFNEQVSSDLAHLHKQMDLRHTDVDEVRRHRDQSRSIAPPLLHHQPQIPPTEQPFPCLANTGSPLIRTRPAASLFGAAQLHAQQEAYPEERRDTYTVKPPKHDFPRFDGSASYLWIDRGESYFKLYCVPSHRWVATASLYIEGHAAHWLQAFHQAYRALNWQELCAVVKEEFGPDEFKMEMHKLL
ncbi:hypothetical protein ZWY2020_010093 [Hordeum vulgare]|nr:hypothetical protein ZWY2020_010093 [Hordeum vulgare]